MVTNKMNKWMKVGMLVCISALVACQPKGGQSNEVETLGRDTLAEPVDTVIFDFEACYISQPSEGREIYIGTVTYGEDAPVVVHNFKTGRRDTIMADINTYPHHLFEGRTKDEVFVFSVAGSGSCGWLTRVDIKEKKTKYVDLGLGIGDVKKTRKGFEVDCFAKPEWVEDTVGHHWKEIFDYDLKMIKTYEVDCVRNVK